MTIKRKENKNGMKVSGDESGEPKDKHNFNKK